MTACPIRVTPRENFKLFVELSDGRSGVIDMRPHLWGPSFAKLLDPKEFARVFLGEYAIISWPNGADIAPEFVEESLKINSGNSRQD